MQLPVISASGTSYEVGRQIGLAARASLADMHEQLIRRYGERWRALLEASGPFLRATEDCLPRVVQELQGCAEGARLPFVDLFLMSVEELLYEEVRGDSSGQVHADEREWGDKGCTDLAAAPPATGDGRVWVAHNNDLAPSARDQLFLTRFGVTGEPEIMAVTVGGIFISIGLNREGLSLTGNQLYANDSRVGVPRLLIVRDILAQTSFEAAVQSAQLPARASSYNNLIASADGRIVNAEGSASACQLIWAEAGGTYHSNHYLSPEMRRYEQSDHHLSPTQSRASRARDYVVKYHGRIDFDVCRQFSRDHVYAPWSVCKHNGDGVTVFGSIINVSEQELWLTRGNPCLSEYELYEFEASIESRAELSAV